MKINYFKCEIRPGVYPGFVEFSIKFAVDPPFQNGESIVERRECIPVDHFEDTFAHCMQYTEQSIRRFIKENKPLSLEEVQFMAEKGLQES